ncbi:MAG: acyl-CoA thioesterase [Phenylobacterium sp.]|uniref:acyl-CoA thioesterase n=1 Tax=Phenylobacterium sp. TaxID=1871053 RepID=UPI0025EEC8A3|nr:acyl-CoA thioesterase [Phenylobacterium sp.]MCG9917524.1 acyl-CoA thioesterase [Phenylobacterium sp.]
MPADTNPNGDVFGGWLMCQVDLAASGVASQRAKDRVVTVAADSMTFLRPVQVGDEGLVHAALARAGRTLMRIEVEAWRRVRQSADHEKVMEAAFTFVALDDEGRPRELPSPSASL